MQGFVMVAAQRHGEFVTDFASEGSGLRKLDVMRIAGRSLTDKARMRCDEAEMLLVPRSP
jgi:hypothetical protein